MDSLGKTSLKNNDFYAGVTLRVGPLGDKSNCWAFLHFLLGRSYKDGI
jgi:hypothetical protein